MSCVLVLVELGVPRSMMRLLLTLLIAAGAIESGTLFQHCLIAWTSLQTINIVIIIIYASFKFHVIFNIVFFMIGKIH